MFMNAERKQVLDEIVQAVADAFPEDAQFSCSEESDSNFVARWKLKDQPPHLTQTSRPVIVRFADTALRAYSALSQSQKEAAFAHLRQVIRQGMKHYDEGRSAERGDIRSPHVIHTAPEFLELWKYGGAG
jgi:23S rRNA G2069 N7-methylase RlmK/C1962 C5-methylase RlmI